MSQFKNNSGTFLTKSLFLETSYEDRSSVQFTLKDQDHDGYRSLYRLYMESDDPTEILFAEEHLGGWAHWEGIKDASWFKPYITRWRYELELRLRAKALRAIRQVANDTYHKQVLEANKFLLTGNWKGEAPRGKGRPSKEQIKEEANAYFQETQDDLNRIQAKVN